MKILNDIEWICYELMQTYFVILLCHEEFWYFFYFTATLKRIFLTDEIKDWKGVNTVT